MVTLNKQNNIQLINNFLNQSIMKKSLFAIFAVAACFASCSKVVESTVFDNPISFDNYVGKDAMTRASVVENVKSVRVNAHLRPKASTHAFLANFMNNQEVKWEAAAQGDGGSWTYAPAKFWPAADQVVDFVAWVPVNNATVENATLEFTVPKEVKMQTDLLVAGSQMGLNRAADNSPVNLNFKHLLSRIGFQISATGIPNDDVTVVELVEVTLNGGFASSGVVDMTKDINNIAIAAADDTETTSAYTLTGTHFGWEDNVMTNGDTQNTDESYIMLIPDGNDPESITVTYTITTDNGDGTTTEVENTADFDLDGNSSFVYEAGKAYKYIFRITLESITFEVEETPWDETTPDKDITPVDPTTGK